MYNPGTLKNADTHSVSVLGNLKCIFLETQKKIMVIHKDFTWKLTCVYLETKNAYTLSLHGKLKCIFLEIRKAYTMTDFILKIEAFARLET